MSELSCDTPFIGQIGALDLVRNPVDASNPVTSILVHEIQPIKITL